jgi:16S rRNA (cytidine1402-2'-O)-methyltransferase
LIHNVAIMTSKRSTERHGVEVGKAAGNAAGRLFVVATPIGNLDDITLRALRVLAEADGVAAEDTRHSRGLLAHHGLLAHGGLQRPLTALHEHNKEQQSQRLLERLRSGESIALISDAGTPLLSDPGFRLVGLAAAAGIEVVAVPGPSALTAALSISGLPTDRFAFEGFLPARRSARLKALAQLREEPRTVVFFESSHRIADSLADLRDSFGGERPAAVCREMTKQFETVLRGSLDQLAERVAADPDQRRGEFVVVVGGCAEAVADALPQAVRLARELQPLVGASQAARTAARLMDVSRRAVYDALAD